MFLQPGLRNSDGPMKHQVSQVSHCWRTPQLVNLRCKESAETSNYCCMGSISQSSQGCPPACALTGTWLGFCCRDSQLPSRCRPLGCVRWAAPQKIPIPIRAPSSPSSFAISNPALPALFAFLHSLSSSYASAFSQIPYFYHPNQKFSHSDHRDLSFWQFSALLLDIHRSDLFRALVSIRLTKSPHNLSHLLSRHCSTYKQLRNTQKDFRYLYHVALS